MRFALVFICFCGTLFANNAQQAFQKALEFEKNNDINNALKWYKISAKLSLQNEQNTTKNEPQIINEQIANIKIQQKEYENTINKIDDNQTNQTLGQMFFSYFKLLPYKTNYALPLVYDKTASLGKKHFETQFQISFKKDLASNLLGFNERYAFGYTQISFWETFKNSKPFRESNYQPELFVYGLFENQKRALKGYQIGLLHESNGEDFENSRSWNRIYLSTFWQFGNVFLTPRVWYRFPEREKRSINDDKGDDNPDIQSYYGYGDLELMYPYKNHVFKAKLRNNLKFNSQNKGALEFEWSFPLWSKDFFGYINYFTGYGRSLQEYNAHTDRIGIGFALSR